jgi:hypothetical protein
MTTAIDEYTERLFNFGTNIGKPLGKFRRDEGLRRSSTAIEAL